jgi:hypothetical protein
MEELPMKRFHSKVLRTDHPMTTGLFLLATLLALFLLIPNMEAAGGDVPGCPHAAKKASPGCPYKAGAQAAGCPCMQASKGCLHALKGDLQLSEEQVERIKGIRSRFEEDSTELRAAKRKQKEELDRLFRDSNAGTDEIIAARKALFTLKEELGEMATDARLKIRGELTAEQLSGLPAGSWHKILPYGRGGKCKGKCGGKCKGPKGGHTCPYKKGPPEDSPS